MSLFTHLLFIRMDQLLWCKFIYSKWFDRLCSLLSSVRLLAPTFTLITFSLRIKVLVVFQSLNFEWMCAISAPTETVNFIEKHQQVNGFPNSALAKAWILLVISSFAFWSFVFAGEWLKLQNARKKTTKVILIFKFVHWNEFCYGIKAEIELCRWRCVRVFYSPLYSLFESHRTIWVINFNVKAFKPNAISFYCFVLLFHFFSSLSCMRFVTSLYTPH